MCVLCVFVFVFLKPPHSSPFFFAKNSYSFCHDFCHQKRCEAEALERTLGAAGAEAGVVRGTVEAWERAVTGAALREALLEKRLQESQRIVEQQRDQLAQQEQNLIEMTAQRLVVEKGYREKVAELTLQLAEGKRKHDALAKSTKSASARFKRVLSLTKSVVGA